MRWFPPFCRSFSVPLHLPIDVSMHLCISIHDVQYMLIKVSLISLHALLWVLYRLYVPVNIIFSFAQDHWNPNILTFYSWNGESATVFIFISGKLRILSNEKNSRVLIWFLSMERFVYYNFFLLKYFFTCENTLLFYSFFTVNHDSRVYQCPPT